MHENPRPTLFLCPRDFETASPKKRKTVRKELFAATNEKPILAGKQFTKHTSASEEKYTQHVALHFHHINRESCVRVFTGLSSTDIFGKIFSWLTVRAKHMQYWKGEKVTLTPERVSGLHGLLLWFWRSPRMIALQLEIYLFCTILSEVSSK